MRRNPEIKQSDCALITPDPQEIEQLKSTGQVSSYEQLDKLVDDFERVLKNHGVVIRKDSELEKTCLAVTEVLGNEEAFKAKREEPAYAAFTNPVESIAPRIQKVIREKRCAVLSEIKKKPLLAMFRKKKAIPAFLAFAQTATGLNVRGNLYPTSMITLSAAYFGWRKPYKALFRKINDALHERPHSPARPSGLFRNSWLKLILIALLIIVVLALGIIITTR